MAYLYLTLAIIAEANGTIVAQRAGRLQQARPDGQCRHFLCHGNLLSVDRAAHDTGPA